MKTADCHTILPGRFIAVCTLFLAIGSGAMAQENEDNLIPVEMAKWDGISERLNESEIVVVALVDSVDASDPDDVSGGQLTPKKTLDQQLRKLRALGDNPIPGLDDKVPFSNRIFILVVENTGKGDAAALESHEQRARAMYGMMGAHPYVMSNPVIYLIHKGKLVRGYGVKYHSPGRDGALLAELVTALLSPRSTRRNPAPGNRHDEGSRTARKAGQPGGHRLPEGSIHPNLRQWELLRGLFLLLDRSAGSQRSGERALGIDDL